MLVAATSTSLFFFGCGSSDEPAHGGKAGGAGVENTGADNAGAADDGGAPDTGESPGAGGTTDVGDGPSGEAGETSEPTGHVFSIKFDYRFDRAGYFDAPERRAALEAAAATWSALISNDFPSVPAGVKLTLTDPEDRDQLVTVDSLEEDIDDLLVFVGTSEAIDGYGRGGPAGPAETDDMELQQSFFTRQIGNDFQPWAGSISFKGSVDYFFDKTPATTSDIPKTKYDFITLATHELGHVLGFASCPAFVSLERDDNFLGKRAFDAYGGAVPLEADHGHFAEGTQSDGVEALMTPKLINGVRRGPTALDLAAMFDIGYTAR